MLANILKILPIFFSIIVEIQCQANIITGFDMPGRFSHEQVVSKWQHRNLLNMSQNIIKDALYKLRHADVVQSQYKNTYGYELGLIASGIMEQYRHMVMVYRYYSDPKSFKNHEHTIEQIMNGYSVIQSDYNGIMAETVLFYQVLDFHLRRDANNRARARILAKKYNLRPEEVLELINKGIDLDYILAAGDGKFDPIRMRARNIHTRRNFNDTLLKADSLNEKDISSTISNIEKIAEMEGFPIPKDKGPPMDEWIKKNINSSLELNYKKNLRYKKWAEKWDGFDPDIEGIDIADDIAQMGIKNASDFLLKELKGDFW